MQKEDFLKTLVSDFSLGAINQQSMIGLWEQWLISDWLFGTVVVSDWSLRSTVISNWSLKAMICY